MRNVKTAAKGSRIVIHPWSRDYVIDFENASITDKGNYTSEQSPPYNSVTNFYSLLTAALQ